MAYKDDKGWVVEPGDKVYWKDDDDVFVKARVVLITEQFIYLTAGPLGLGDETDVWRERTALATRRVVPRQAVWTVGSEVSYRFDRPTIFVLSDPEYRRTAS